MPYPFPRIVLPSDPRSVGSLLEVPTAPSISERVMGLQELAVWGHRTSINLLSLVNQPGSNSAPRDNHALIHSHPGQLALPLADTTPLLPLHLTPHLTSNLPLAHELTLFLQFSLVLGQDLKANHSWHFIEGADKVEKTRHPC